MDLDKIEKRTILLQIGLLFNHIFRRILTEEGRANKALKLTIKHQNFGFIDKNITQRASMRRFLDYGLACSPMLVTQKS